jgi:flagellar hook-associated protein 3 FlgL
MSLRPTQSSIFSLVQRGLAMNLSKLAGAQEHVATGKAILRPSDDAVGTGRALSMRRRLGLLERFQDGVKNGRPVLETSTAALEEASGILSEARSLLVQGLNGSMNPDDREALGIQIDLILEKLVDVANTKVGDRFLFAGTRTDREPYVMSTVDGQVVVEYRGNQDIQRVSVGFGAELALNVSGPDVFGRQSVSSIDLSGLTGLKLGTTANQGSGYADIRLRHDATVGTPGSGIALVSGGALDTILNDHTLSVDAAAGTISLDGGPAVPIPDPADPEYSHLVVTNAEGAEVHLDLTGYDGTSSAVTLTGEGSIALGGDSFTPIDFSETDLQLVDDASGTVLHVDTTAVHRAGPELVSFTGATDLFSVLSGVAADLRNTEGLPSQDVIDRLNLRFGELEQNYNQVLKALGTLGARTERMISSGERLETLSLNVESLLSQVEDVDITTVILEMNQAEQTLQLAQATGSRLIQRTLLDFLR